MKELILTSLISFLSFGSISQGFMDNPCSTFPYPSGSEVTIDGACLGVSMATVSQNIQNGCSYGSYADGWVWFLGDGSNVQITFNTTSGDPVMAVYSVASPPCSGTTSLACVDSGYGGDNESVTVSTQCDTYYLIVIENYPSSGNAIGCISVSHIGSPVIGCTDPLANNYDPLATVNCGCTYNLGCTDPLANNYDPTAVIDDGSCTYNMGCTDPLATNYDPTAVVDDGSCTYPTPDYTHPTTGINNEKVGACLVNDCGPATYTDNGGFTNNFSNNIQTTGGYSPQNAIYRVFCPDEAGSCLRVTFNEFNTPEVWDLMWVRNGPTEYSPVFTSSPMQASPWGGVYSSALYGNLNSQTPFSFTSTDASGCLTFNFLSDGGGLASGWSAVLECVPCAGGPNGTDPNDCDRLIPLCSDATVSGNATGPGLDSDGCTPGICPAGGENHTIWYKILAQTSGTIDITITPTDPNDDYDFAIYGPNVTCDALGSPLRCTDSGNTGTTGTSSSAGDNTEDVFGDKYVQTLNANAGESFIIVVDEWTTNTSSTGFSLSFGGTADLDCAILPVELVEFNATYQPIENVVDIHWITDSEFNTDYFEVQKSTDGEHFEVINTVDAQGFTNYQTQYVTIDENPFPGINYFRLKQFDRDGAFKFSDLRSVNILDDENDLMSVFPNPSEGLTEIIFNCYSSQEAEISIKSLDGKVVMSNSMESKPGANRIEFDSNVLSNGLYIIEVRTKHKTFVERLIKK